MRTGNNNAPDFPSKYAAPKYGLATYVVVDGETRRVTTKFVETKYTEEILKFLESKNNELAYGEWEAFYNELSSGKYKVLKFVKDIIKEINGRISIGGNKNAQGTI